MVVGIVATIGTDIVLHQIGVFRRGAHRWSATTEPLTCDLSTAPSTDRGKLHHARPRADRPMQHALVGGVPGPCRGHVVPGTWNKDRLSGLTGIALRSSC